MDFGEEIDNIAVSFPKREMYNLSSQISRAADSIAEVVTCLCKAKRRSYISEPIFDKLYKESFDLMNMTLAI